MTNALLDEEILSTRETLPVPATPPPEVYACPYCPWSRPKLPGMQRLRGAHIKRAHPEHWTGPAKKAAAARTTPARRGRPPKATTTRPPATARPPATGARRRSSADFIAKNVTRAAKFLENITPAGGAALKFSAPAIGPALDDLIAGTRLDRPVQAISGASEKWERLSDAIGLPLMATLCEINPDLFIPLLEDDMRDAVRAVMAASLPLIKKRREEDRKVTEALVELKAMDPVLAESEDPIGDILQGFFTRATDSDKGDAEPS